MPTTCRRDMDELFALYAEWVDLVELNCPDSNDFAFEVAFNDGEYLNLEEAYASPHIAEQLYANRHKPHHVTHDGHTTGQAGNTSLLVTLAEAIKAAVAAKVEWARIVFDNIEDGWDEEQVEQATQAMQLAAKLERIAPTLLGARPDSEMFPTDTPFVIMTVDGDVAVCMDLSDQGTWYWAGVAGAHTTAQVAQEVGRLEFRIIEPRSDN